LIRGGAAPLPTIIFDARRHCTAPVFYYQTAAVNFSHARISTTGMKDPKKIHVGGYIPWAKLPQLPK